MQINTKFEIGQEVLVVYAEQGEVRIYKDVITGIYIDEATIHYAFEIYDNDREEELLVQLNNKAALLDKIEETMEKMRNAIF